MPGAGELVPANETERVHHDLYRTLDAGEASFLEEIRVEQDAEHGSYVVFGIDECICDRLNRFRVAGGYALPCRNLRLVPPRRSCKGGAL